MNKEYCVISHTHWDREWYFTFEQFRYRLVKLIDNLLDIMENEKDFVFHLDAQTIVLEDYLKIKPQNKEKLEKYIKEGRIIVGPWYVQNDFFLTDGEATVRNLLIGTKIANEFGACGTTGYIPDQFGNISQLPQIYNQFGIETCLLGRGYSFWHRNENDELVRDMTPPEFYWKGKDGSKVLSVRFTTWYNNAQRFSEDIPRNVKLIDFIEGAYQGTARAPYYLLMNGVDHLEAQENLLPILKETNKLLKDGELKQCTMQEFTDKLKDWMKETGTEIEEYVGELRNGNDYDLLKGTLSSRVYLKQDNARLQNKVENIIEPLYTLAELKGMKDIYPKEYLTYLWKSIIENHPHDSICGCSMDAVHKNMQDRTARINEVSDEMIHDVLSALTTSVTRDDMTEDDYIVTVWNTCEEAVSGVAEVELNFPITEDFNNFVLLDENGNEAEYEAVRKDFYSLKTTSPINLPGELDVDSYLVKIAVDNIEPMGYRSYVVKKADGRRRICAEEPKQCENIKLENDRFTVAVNPMGEVDITDKKLKKTYANCIRLEDSGDSGHSYVYHEALNDTPITTDDIKPVVELVKDTNIEKICSVKYDLMLPAGLNPDTVERSADLISNPVEIVLTLKKGTPWVDITCKVENNSRDHRLRILFDTEMATDFTTSLVPYDTVERDRKAVLKRVDNGTQPNSGMIYIADKGTSLAIFNEGLYEYEHLLGDKGTIAVTLVRGTGSISTLRDRKQRSMMRQDGIQTLGKFELKLGISFEDGEDNVSGFVRMAKRFNNPAITYFQPYTERKFTGGRPQVQDTDIAELFFREEPYKDIKLERTAGFMEFIGDAMTVSAVKLSENGKRIVVRAYNTTDNEAEFAVKTAENISGAVKLRADESEVGAIAVNDNKTETIKVKPREIVTIGLDM